MNDQPRSKARPAAAAAAADPAGANPVLVEVRRGDMVESRHRGAAAVLDATGRRVAAWGDTGAAVFPRSAIKPLQALALVETGAADAFALGDAELALACASHAGEPRHVRLAAEWLKRIGLDEGDLECGAHLPTHARTADAMIARGERPTALHNNCSGKHAGMLSTALHMGEPTRGYIRGDHPVQLRLRALLEALGDCDLSAAAVGTDGCSIPTIAMPLAAIALAMARFAAPDSLEPKRAAAARRIAAAMETQPFMVAGSGRFCTALIETTEGRVLVKTGAEGVYTAAVPHMGLGVALKIDDGATRASEVAVAAILRHIGALDEAEWVQLHKYAAPGLKNWNDIEVGAVGTAAGWPDKT